MDYKAKRRAIESVINNTASIPSEVSLLNLKNNIKLGYEISNDGKSILIPTI